MKKLRIEEAEDKRKQDSAICNENEHTGDRTSRKQSGSLFATCNERLRPGKLMRISSGQFETRFCDLQRT